MRESASERTESLIEDLLLKVSSVQPLDSASNEKFKSLRLNKYVPSCIQPLEVLIQVLAFNGKPVKNLKGLATMVENCDDEFLKFDLEYQQDVTATKRNEFEDYFFNYIDMLAGFMIFMYFFETYLDIRQLKALKLPTLAKNLEAVGGIAGALGDSVTVSHERNKITVTSDSNFSKRFTPNNNGYTQDINYKTHGKLRRLLGIYGSF
ncbi:uncharacterized protein LOC110265052 [Arachis ipaensis]|uniref:uncharacterized protein LOC110265052 n=1 Tax=Arachis ipaensis TaxID=130454 RepID=UPI000A2B023A|nr:uncharacterized protein LOC110265052 [Arachis ipaensis]